MRTHVAGVACASLLTDHLPTIVMHVHVVLARLFPNPCNQQVIIRQIRQTDHHRKFDRSKINLAGIYPIDDSESESDRVRACSLRCCAGMLCALAGTGVWMIVATYWEVSVAANGQPTSATQ